MCTIYFDLQKAQRDKSKLVYVQRTVTKNGKTFQQGFWVHPSQVKSTDTVLKNQGALNAYQTAQKTAQQQSSVVGNFDKSKYTVLYTTESKTKAMQYAKDNGITWNEHSNPNINWMRCQMAVNKALGGSVTVSTSKPASSATLDVSNLISNFNSLSKKDKVVELLKHNSRDSLISFAKANGITWKENDNAGINWMRCSMALQNYLESHNISDSTNASSDNQNKTQQDKVVSETIDIPSNATTRQKNLIGMINSITKKEDFDLFGSVGMIAEDDTAREFMEKMLKPRYDSWKNGHQPSVGTRAYGYVIGYADDFGNAIVGDTGAFLKGLNQAITSESIASVYKKLSLANMLYPRELMNDTVVPGKNNNNLKRQQSIGIYDLVQSLNGSFSVRNTSDANEFKYNGWDSEIYKKFPAESHGFVRCLEHIKKNNPELASECDRLASTYSDMLKIVDGNQAALEFIFKCNDYSYVESRINQYKSAVQMDKLFVEICKENKLTAREAENTIYYTNGKLTTTQQSIIVRDERGVAKTDASGNLIKINVIDYLSKHKSEYPDLDPTAGFYVGGWSTSSRVRRLLKGEPEDTHQMLDVMENIITKKNFYDIKRKSMELFDISLESGTNGTTFDILSNDSTVWDTHSLYTRKVKNNEELDAVLANLQFIVASNYTCSTTQRQNGYKTRPSKANDNGNALSKTFNYYARENFQDWQSLSIQERNLSIDDANKVVDAQLNNVPTFSKKWFDNAKEYANKYGNENFKGASWDDDPSTESQKKQAKAFSIDFGSYSNITGYMGTPVGDLLTKQIATLAKYCPQMETARFNTPEKIQKQVEDKIGYKPFEIEPPQTSSGSTTNIPELRKLRDELYSKVHCSLKSCDSATYDNIQTKIKQDWDMGKRSSSGSRLYGHISAVFKGAYKVNNSLQEEKMLENAKKLGETPQDFFHGTNHSGATGIIGVDGRFRAPKSSADASKQGLKYAGGMLGSGVYLAKMAGKSAGYFGTWGQSYEPEGCMLMCKAVLGNTYVSSGFNSSAPASYDTVSMQAGTNTGRTILRADEWCVRNPDFVYPEYIVDMGTKRRV